MTEGFAQLLAGREGFAATDADGDRDDGSALGVPHNCVEVKRNEERHFMISMTQASGGMLVPMQ